MVEKNESDEYPMNVIRVADELLQYLLVELSWGRDLKAGIDGEAPREVVILVPEEEVTDLC